MIYRELVLFTEKIYYLPRKAMIYREVFIEKRDDLPKIDRIYREKLGFIEKIYDLSRISMILRIFLCIDELLF